MPNVLTEQQIQALMSAPDTRTRLGARDKALLSVMLFGGLRIAEACNLRWDDVEYDSGHTRLTFEGKGGKVRTVSLPETAVKAINRWKTLARNSTYVFPGKTANTLSTRTGRWVVSQLSNKAGLPNWVHPHSLRHTYGSRVMRKTGDLFLTARVMGHSSPQTTAKHYLAFDASYADKAAEIW